MSYKNVVFRMYKKLLQLNNKKKNNPIKRWAKNLISHFSKEDIQMVNKHMKRCSTLLVNSEMQIQTMRYRFITTRVAMIKKKKKRKIISVGKDVESTGTLIHRW